MHNLRYTVVVSSCDGYSDLWDPFFKILKAEWPALADKQIPIILNTESKVYSYEGLNLRTLQLYGPKDDPVWTERLRRTLDAVDTEYILFLLDDFFMQSEVDDRKIDQCIKWMDENHRISQFSFKETYASINIRDNKYKGFERRPLFGRYKFNCAAALWRRDRFISYLKKDENPWEWEVFGNWRSYRHPYHLFYSHIPGEDRVFKYTYEMDENTFWGSGVYRGKWFVPSVDPIFKKHGIKIDYSIRGTISADEFETKTEINESPKKREDVPKWEQALWFARPVYCRLAGALGLIRYVTAHINHFF